MMIRWQALIVQRLRGIHIHYVAQVRRIRCVVVASLWVCGLVLGIIIWHLIVAWVVWMIWWHHTTVSLMICWILLRHASLVIIWSRVVLVRVIVRDVGLTRLGADTVETAESGALLVVMMVVAIHVTSVAYWASTMIVVVIIRIWAQEIVIVAIFTNWVMRLIVNLDIGLTELVKDRSWSLSINSRDLCHYLAVVGAVIVLATTLNLLVGADLWGTIFVAIRSKVFALGRFVWRSITCVQKVSSWALLIIDNPVFPKRSC